MLAERGWGLTSWLLLALVLEDEGESHGYKLAERFQQRFGLFLPFEARHAVYRFLDLLEGDGLIAGQAKPTGKGRLKRRVEYEATEAAEPALKQWLISCPPPTRHWRLEVLARIAAARTLAIPALLTLVERYQRYAQADAESVERQTLLLPDARESPASLVGHMMLDELRRTLASGITWAEHWHNEIESTRQ
jgi:DNA-binding PadR family transcriptional regulator